MIGYANRRSPLWRLTPRQREVLGLVAAGRSNLAIAKQLGVTERAVVRHVSHIYDQLDIFETGDDHRRVLAAVTWLTAESEALPVPA